MRLRWERAPRVPRFPVWAIALVGSWLLLVLAGVLLEFHGAPIQETCLFLRVTGHPCLACGSTRVVLCFWEWDWVGALRWNPLMAAGLALGGLGLLGRAITARRPVIEFSRGERIGAYVLAVALLAVNWMWVFRVQG